MLPGSRRMVFAVLVLGTIALLLSVMTWSFMAAGISVAEWVLLACFAMTLPWTVIGFWNAVTGFVLLQTRENPAEHVFPALKNIDDDEAITSSVAIAMCIRNENTRQVERNLMAMIAQLAASGNANNFHVYVLSDSSFPDVINEEEPVFAELKKRWAGVMDITYRRREENPGFKAGNIRDFCERWGEKHDFMLTLDADSVMSAPVMLRMIRIMQKNENLGILQSLVVGLPSDSAFTRAFQFGMRMGMKSYTIGSAWWQADCGPYWGHNALLRLRPFIDHCHLPRLSGNGPLSGWVLSHDQVEAAFMRRAGYECRVLAEEGGSYEENPPHILEFIRRDLRWCHGNMQYFKLLTEPGLLLTSRIQLVLAIMMFAGSPAWMLFVLVATAAFVVPEFMNFELRSVGPAYLLFAVIMTMVFAPKIASILDVLIKRDLRKSFGGGFPVVLGAGVEIVFSMMLAPVMAVANTIFLVRLAMGKAKGWVAQRRQSVSLPFGTTARHLWPQTLFGLAGTYFVLGSANLSFAVGVICLPVFIGPLVAIPFGVLSSQAFLGRWAARSGIWQLPEEEMPPVIIRALDLPAIGIRAKGNGIDELRSPLTTEQVLDMDIVADDTAGNQAALPELVMAGRPGAIS